MRWRAGVKQLDADATSRDPRHYKGQVHLVQGYMLENVEPTEQDYSSDFLKNPSSNIETEIKIEIIPDSMSTEIEEFSSQSKGQEKPLLVALSTKNKHKLPETEEVKGEEDKKLNQAIKLSLNLAMANLAESQDKDDKLLQIKKRVKNGEKIAKYVLEQDILKYQDKLVIPKHEIPMIIWLFHDHPFAGHTGLSKLEEQLSTRYYWPNMRRELKEYLKSCSCTRTKATQTHKKGKTLVFSHYSPMECLQFDLVGPFPLSKKGNQYWLTLIDRYTRYVEFVPIRSKDAIIVARAIFDTWITRFGCPRVLMSDNEFRNEVMQELAKLIVSEQIFTAPYMPSTNGLCERVHRFAQNILQNSIRENLQEWDTYLPTIRFAIITAVIDGLKFSPYELVFGRTATLPANLRIPLDTRAIPADVRTYFNEQIHALHEIRKTFEYTQNKKESRMRYYRDNSQNRKESDLQVGDLVFHTKEHYFKEENKKGLQKLLGRWKGPDPIVEKLNSGNTFIVLVGEEKKTFNIRDLCLYKGEDPPMYREMPDISATEPLLASEEVKEAGEEQKTQTSSSTPQTTVNSEEGKLNQDELQDQVNKFFEELKKEEMSSEGRSELIAREVKEKKTPRKRDREVEDMKAHGKEVRAKRARMDRNSPAKAPDPDTESKLVRLEENQWVLLVDQDLSKTGKKSLMMGKVILVVPEGIEVQIYQPKGLKKQNYIFPLYYREKGRSFEKKASDNIPPRQGWKPWRVVVTTKKKETMKLIDCDLGQNYSGIPSQKMWSLYKQVWDDKVRETELHFADFNELLKNSINRE